MTTAATPLWIPCLSLTCDYCNEHILSSPQTCTCTYTHANKQTQTQTHTYKQTYSEHATTTTTTVTTSSLPHFEHINQATNQPYSIVNKTK